ncbi:GatB/YqeY domain-containing protein [Rhodoligotrophos defluvii]|uniref:GatB/YqeY domain-containing protein n=1 Tax=Rhodoligotrophos defluvii TaxID=2561934 RepID=UPI0010C9E8C7|nr:GatB/YqeY domain-containing protein [Rhodoligotrophos defluvii]
MSATIRERVNEGLKAAMKSQDKRRISTLRLINAAVKDRIIHNRGAGKGDELDDAELLDILARMIKQREESQQVYEQAGRLELAEQEREEIAVIREFMPRQLSEAEVQTAVDGIIAELGASGLKDMGRVMAELKSRHAGALDVAKAGAIAKEKLK